MTYYTILTGLQVNGNFGATYVTFTHNLSITPALLVARPIPHQAVQNATVPLIVGTIGTNVVTVGVIASGAQTFDLEVQQIHSLIA